MILEQAIEVLKTEAESINELTRKIDENFVKMVEAICNTKGKVVISGIGKSGLIGQKIVATLNSTGTKAFFLHPVEALHGDLGLVSPCDVVLAMSNSGETTELNMLTPNLREMGCTIIALTGNKNSTLGRESDFVIDVGVEKEACPLGLAPTSSTTALLAMGDALAVVLINQKKFKSSDFKKYHPGGKLGQRLACNVATLMVSPEKIPTVSSAQTTRDAIKQMDKFSLGVVIVNSEEKDLAGVVTDGDIRHLISSGKLDLNAAVSGIMTENPKFIPESSPVYDALNLMEEFEITVLPVLNSENRIAGLLHLHDILGKGEFKFNGS